MSQVIDYLGVSREESECVKITHGLYVGQWIRKNACATLYPPQYGVGSYTTWDCARMCEVLPGAFLRDDGRFYERIFLEDNGDACEAWISNLAAESLNVCGECGCLCVDEAMHGDYCPDCRDPYAVPEVPADRLLGYNDRAADSLPPQDTDGLRDGLLMIGIEVEVEARESRNDALEQLAEIMPEGYCVYKRDGSLNDYLGIEIVTRPDSVRLHKEVWAAVLGGETGDRVREAVKGWYGASCGMHVHVSRDCMSSETAMRAGLWVNSVLNRKIVNTVAGRESARWSAFKDKFKDDFSDGRFPGDDRYEAINYTNEETIEFRIFRTNLSQHGMLKNIEFVEALCRYCAQATDEEVENPKGFMRYLKTHEQEFPALIGFLAKRKIIRSSARFTDNGEEVDDFTDDAEHAAKWANINRGIVEDTINSSAYYYWNEGNTVQWCVDNAMSRIRKIAQKAKVYKIPGMALSKKAVMSGVRANIRSTSGTAHLYAVKDMHDTMIRNITAGYNDSALMWANRIVKYARRLKPLMNGTDMTKIEKYANEAKDMIRKARGQRPRRRRITDPLRPTIERTDRRLVYINGEYRWINVEVHS